MGRTGVAGVVQRCWGRIPAKCGEFENPNGALVRVIIISVCMDVCECGWMCEWVSGWMDGWIHVDG